MRKSIRWFLIVVLLLDTTAAVILLTGGFAVPGVMASGTPNEVAHEPEPTREALELLGHQLVERAEQLRRREAELDEVLRGLEIQQRITERNTEAEPTAGGAGPVEPPPEPNEAFQRLLRAYENMEPESAAVALAELATLDTEAVLQLLSGWKPRTSGQILDALTQTHPVLAAELSYRIWKGDGNNGPAAAKDGR